MRHRGVGNAPLFAAFVAICALAGSCRPDPAADVTDAQVDAALHGGAGTSERVGVVSEALTTTPICYGAAGLQPMAPAPMVGLCPAHRNQSPAVGAQSGAKPSGWTSGVAMNGIVRGSPVVSSTGMIVGGSTARLVAVNPSGSTRWFLTPGMSSGSSAAFGADGSVYTVTSEGTPKVRSLAPSDGSSHWSVSINGAASSGPALSSDGATVYVTTQSGRLYALNSANGQTRWSITKGAITTSPAIAADGTIYIGADDGLYAINPSNGATLWSRSFGTGGFVRASPAIAADGTIYVGTDLKRLEATNPDGTARWSFTATGMGLVRSSPAVATDGTIYFGTRDHKLYAVNPNGTAKWAFTTGGNVDSSPAVGADGTIYVGSDDFKLYAIRPNGTQLFNVATGNFIRGGVAIGRNGTVYVGSDDQKLWAFGPGTCAGTDTTCDGRDDNCNGNVDESYAAQATSCGLGPCARTGATSCVGGAVQSSCTPGTPAPSDATCNGVDDDCNGSADDGYASHATSCGAGACARTGTASCVGGSVHDSCAPGTPGGSDTTCDGVDDNCNGTKDEGYVGSATSCGTGPCARAGTTVCANASAHDGCTPGTPAANDSSCNGVDDDCNGSVDDGCTSVGLPWNDDFETPPPSSLPATDLSSRFAVVRGDVGRGARVARRGWACEFGSQQFAPPSGPAEVVKFLNTSGYGNVTLRFWRLLAFNGQDTWTVRYSTTSADGPWASLETVTASDGSWHELALQLPTSAQLWLSFSVDFGQTAYYDEWAFLDDVRVTGDHACTTAADCNDGFGCSSDQCNGGVCAHTASTDGTPCSDRSVHDGAPGAGFCSANHCIECLTDADCPERDGASCTTPVCQQQHCSEQPSATCNLSWGPSCTPTTAKFVPSDLVSSPQQGVIGGAALGVGMASSGSRVVIGAWADGTADAADGAAFVYHFDGSNWNEEAKLVASDPLTGSFGSSVTIDGDTIAVGAPARDDGAAGLTRVGAVYVYDYSSGAWQSSAELFPPELHQNSVFGSSVALSGEWLAVSGFDSDSSESPFPGAVWLYHHQSGQWTYVRKLKPADLSSFGDFGGGLALSGNLLLANGQTSVGDTIRGTVYAFHYDGTTWTQTQSFRPSDSEADPPQGDFGDGFGLKIAIDGTTALIGAYPHDGDQPDEGAAYVYRYSNGTWQQVQELHPPDLTWAAQFGSSVALSGSIAVVTAEMQDPPANRPENRALPAAGMARAYVYQYDSVHDSWLLARTVTPGDANAGPNMFGWSSAIANGTVFVGAPAASAAGFGTAPGATYAYSCGGTICRNGTNESGCNSGGTCSAGTPCGNGVSGCTTDADCQAGLACGFGIGPRYGLPASAGVCWDAGTCATLHPDPSTCGSTSAYCGTCCIPSCSASGQPDGCGGTCAACNPNVDSDHDGLSDCAEQQDGDAWTDPLIANGVLAALGASCKTAPTCADVTDTAAIARCFQARQTNVVSSGWDFSTSDSDACQPGFGITPSFTQCGADFAIRYGASIRLSTAGTYCFQLNGATDNQCASLSVAGLPMVAATNGQAFCQAFAAGVYPISWFYETTNHSHNELHLRYCYSASGNCTPDQAVTASMLRLPGDSSDNSVCTPNCAGKTCGDDGCGGYCGTACGQGAGGCTSNADCATGLVCGANNGPRFGLASGVRACWAQTCDGIHHGAVPCGSISDTCGLCAACEPSCDGRRCGSDGCGGSCGSCASGLSCDGAIGVCVGPQLPPRFELPPDLTVPTAGVGTLPGHVEVTSSGASTYDIPLEVPPGRGGVQPQLTLRYSSERANGYLGVGWTLDGFSTITRCNKTIAQDGAASSPTFGPDDALCLDGSRLVEIPEEGSGQVRVYHTEYEQFARVEATFGTDPNEPLEFSVRAKDGRIFEYKQRITGVPPGGNLGPLAELFGLSLPTQVWALSAITDHVGVNRMEIAYEDRSRITADGVVREYFPREITYSDPSSPIGVRFFYSFDPEYGETRPDPIGGWRNGVQLHTEGLLRRLSVRVDGNYVRHYVFGYLANTASEPLSRLGNVWDCAGANEVENSGCKPATHFEYLPTLTAPTYHSIPGIASLGKSVNNSDGYSDRFPPIPLEVNGDGVADFLFAYGLHPQSFLDGENWHWYSAISTRHSDGSITYDVAPTGLLIGDVYWKSLIALSTVSTAESSGAASPIDWDNDGRTDVLEFNWGQPNTPLVYTVVRYDGTSFIRWSTDIPQALGQDNEDRPGQTYVLDVNGDHYEDLLVCDTASDGFHWRLYRNQGGASTGSALPNGNVPGLFQALREDLQLALPCSRGGLPIDVDGDGTMELLISQGTAGDPGVVLHFPGNGAATQISTNAIAGYSGKDVGALNAPVAGIKSIDINGDGLKDVVRYDLLSPHSARSLVSLRIQISRGDGTFAFASQTIDVGGADWTMARAHGWDANLDGKEDLTGWLSLGVGAGLTSMLSDGTHFVGMMPGINDFKVSSQAADINGDGVLDLGGFEGYAELSPQQHAVLYSVTNGLGARTELRYAPYSNTDFYTSTLFDGATTTCKAPFVCSMPRGYVVSDRIEFDQPYRVPDQTTPSRRYQYRYKGEHSDAFGRGFLGFEETRKEHRSIDGIELKNLTVASFDNHTRDAATQDYPFANEPLRVVQTDYIGDREYESQIDHAYEVVRPKAQTHATFEKQSSSNESVFFYVSGTRDSLLTDFHVIASRDEFGNVTQEQFTSNNNIARVINRSYERGQFLADWLISLPTHVDETESVLTGSGTTTRTRVVDATHYANGLLEQTTRDPNNPPTKLVTDYGRDLAGNTTSLTQTGISQGATQVRQTTVEYADHLEYPKKVTNALNQTTEVQYNRSTGQLEALKDANGILQQWRYDGFGRLGLAAPSDGNNAHVSYQYFDTARPFAVDTLSDDGTHTRSELDVRGRVKNSRTWEWQGRELVQAFDYDADGRLSAVSRPTAANLTPAADTTYLYDNHDVARAITRGGKTTSTCYDARTFCTTSARGFTRCAITDSRHRVVRAVDPVAEDCETARENAITRSGVGYTYDPFDAASTITDLNGNVTQLVADSWGNTISLTDPDSGFQGSGFNAFGELDSSVDATNREFLFEHDPLGRLVRESAIDLAGSDPTETTQWIYDGGATFESNQGELRGALTETQSPDGVHQRYRYDPLTGQLVGRVDEVAGEAFETTIRYDGLGRVYRIEYPQDPRTPGLPVFTVEQSYDGFGHVQAVIDTSRPTDPLWQVTAMDNFGQVTGESYGGGLASGHIFDELGRSRQITAASAGQIAQSTIYSYDDDENVGTRTDAVRGHTETFAYDGDDRISSDPSYLNTTYTYDYGTIGNISHASYVQYDPNHAHAVSYDGVRNYQYDNDGRRILAILHGETSDILERTTYTPTGQPRSTWYESAQGTRSNVVNFAYNANRRRTVKDSEFATTVYSGGLYERRVPKAAGAPIEHVYYVSNGGDRIVAQVSATLGSAPRTYALHVDNLGSTRFIRDDQGNTQEFDWSAFGSVRNPDWTNSTVPATTLTSVHLGFTGQEHDPEHGLINMGGRIYDPAAKQFTTPDPFVQDAFTSKGLNRYAYVFNNPLGNIDPTGFQSVEVDPGAELETAGQSGAGAESAAAASDDEPNHGDWAEVDEEGNMTVHGIREPNESTKVCRETGGGSDNAGIGGGNGSNPLPSSPTRGLTDGAEAKRQAERYGSVEPRRLTPGERMGGRPSNAVQTRMEILEDLLPLVLQEIFIRGMPGPPEIPPGFTTAPSVPRVSLEESAPPPTAAPAAAEPEPVEWTFSRSQDVEAVKHMEDAQAAGHPSEGTIARSGKAARRAAAMKGHATRPGYDRDEYPPAIFKEGGAGASVRHINRSDNRGAGARIGHKARGLPDGTKVVIKIVD